MDPQGSLMDDNDYSTSKNHVEIMKEDVVQSQDDVYNFNDVDPSQLAREMDVEDEEQERLNHPSQSTEERLQSFLSLKQTALTLKDEFLTTGCSNIDGFLGGGILRRGLTEIVGPAGLGKTQISLQLAMTVQLPVKMGGFGSGTIYINTEGPFPSPRLLQISEHLRKKFGSHAFPENPSDSLYLIEAPDTRHLQRCLDIEVPQILQEHKVGLLLVDSIAATFRYGSDYEDMKSKDRTNDLRMIGRKLHDLAHKQGLVLICINQVTAAFSPEDAYSQDFAPSLGITWRNLVTNRILISKNEHDQRSMQLPFSSYLPTYATMENDGSCRRRMITFEIGEEGVFSKDEGYRKQGGSRK